MVVGNISKSCDKLIFHSSRLYFLTPHLPPLLFVLWLFRHRDCERLLLSRGRLLVEQGSGWFEFQEIRESNLRKYKIPTYLWMESMSGMGPFLSFPTGKSILGNAIVGPPVGVAALGAQAIAQFRDMIFLHKRKRAVSYLLTPTMVHFMGFPSSCLLW